MYKELSKTFNQQRLNGKSKRNLKLGPLEREKSRKLGMKAAENVLARIQKFIQLERIINCLMD